MKSVYEDFNFLTVTERANFVTLKKFFHRIREERGLLWNNSKRVNPLAVVPTHKSQLFKKSFMYRGAMLWNQLPRNISIERMSFGKFIQVAKTFIVRNRDNMYVKN